MLRLILLTLYMAMGFSQGDDTREKSLPLNIKPSFAGTYGELRSGRFHAGYDFRVGGVVGEPIYAIADGYISRITVTSSGYGNGLYITHPDGTTSIYGHMHQFAPEIAELVTKRQYENESFSVNIVLDSEQMPVERGQFIGTVGNSGSSAAPHLHFEVRTPDGLGPANVANEDYFKYEDNVPPVIQKVNFYSFEDSTGVVRSELVKGFKGSSSKVLRVPGKFYVAVDAHDRQAGTPGKLGLEVYEFLLDGESVYKFQMGEYTYREQETFNSLIDYRERVLSGDVLVKSYVEPGNGFVRQIQHKNRGIFELNDDKVHNVQVVVADLHGNKKVAKFKVQREESGVVDTSKVERVLPWFAPYAYVNSDIKVSLPVMSLFRNEEIVIDTANFDVPVYSKVWRIHNEEVPLRRSGRLEIKVRDLPDSLQSKAFLGYISERGIISYGGGKYVEGGFVKGNLGSFGCYCVSVDTIAPKIKPRFSSVRMIQRSGQIAFTIKDDMSGISHFRAEIDGKWVLANYDKKYDKLWIVLDSERVPKGCEHELVLKVKDNKDNISTFKYKFKW